MTCNCKAELASIIVEVIEAGRASAYGQQFPYDLAQPFRDMKDAVRRLCPPAEPVLDGWRAECKVEHSPGSGWYVRGGAEYPNDLYLWDDGQWHPRATTERSGSNAGFGGTKRGYWVSESAARAALAAATEPGVQPARGPCTCNRNHVDDDEHAPDCGKPAPAVAFDAKKWAETMVRPIVVGGLAGLHELDGSGGYCAFYQDDASNQARINHARQIIAAALRAAESAGYARAKAEQISMPKDRSALIERAINTDDGSCSTFSPKPTHDRPRRWPDGRSGFESKVLKWTGSEWSWTYSTGLNDGDWWLPQPAAPAAAKEGT